MSERQPIVFSIFEFFDNFIKDSDNNSICAFDTEQSILSGIVFDFAYGFIYSPKANIKPGNYKTYINENALKDQLIMKSISSWNKFKQLNDDDYYKVLSDVFNVYDKTIVAPPDITKKYLRTIFKQKNDNRRNLILALEEVERYTKTKKSNTVIDSITKVLKNEVLKLDDHTRSKLLEFRNDLKKAGKIADANSVEKNQQNQENLTKLVYKKRGLKGASTRVKKQEVEFQLRIANNQGSHISFWDYDRLLGKPLELSEETKKTIDNLILKSPYKNSIKTWGEIGKEFHSDLEKQNTVFVTSYNMKSDMRFIENTNKRYNTKGIDFSKIITGCSLNLFQCMIKNAKEDTAVAALLNKTNIGKNINELIQEGKKKINLDVFIEVVGEITKEQKEKILAGSGRHTALGDTKLLVEALQNYFDRMMNKK